MSEFKDVWKFHVKFDQLAPRRIQHLTRRKLAERANFMLEELMEFAEAAGLRLDSNDLKFKPDDLGDQDLPLQADSLIDLVYVAKGTAVMMGLPWKALWDDVQAANMRKVKGTTHRGNKVDVTKPPGWVGPKTEEILKKSGYWRDVFVDKDKVVDALCFDDPEHKS